MKRMCARWAMLALTVGISLSITTRMVSAEELEGFDLGMTIAAADKVVEQNGLSKYYEDASEKDKLRRSYEGTVLGMGGTLDLVFLEGKLILVTAQLEGDSAEMQKHIDRKYAEVDAQHLKLHGDKTESVFPGMKDWVLPDRVITLYRDGSTKMFISVVSRGSQSQ